MQKNIKKIFSCFVLLGSFLFLPFSKAGAINLAVRINDEYTQVIAGDRLSFEVDIKWPENSTRQDLRVEYQIIDPSSDDGYEGSVIASAKVLRAVETQTSYLDYIVVPENADSGKKVLKVVIEDYKDLNQEIFATFNVLKGANQIENYFYILIGAMGFVVILVVAELFVLSRKLDRVAKK